MTICKLCMSGSGQCETHKATNWEKELIERVNEGYNDWEILAVAKAEIKSQRLEVLRECSPVFSTGRRQQLIGRQILDKWLSRGDLTQEQYDSLISEFNL